MACPVAENGRGAVAEVVGQSHDRSWGQGEVVLGGLENHQYLLGLSLEVPMVPFPSLKIPERLLVAFQVSCWAGAWMEGSIHQGAPGPLLGHDERVRPGE